MRINEILFDRDGRMTYGFAFRGFRSNGTMAGMTSWTFYFTVSQCFHAFQDAECPADQMHTARDESMDLGLALLLQASDILDSVLYAWQHFDSC